MKSADVFSMVTGLATVIRQRMTCTIPVWSVFTWRWCCVIDPSMSARRRRSAWVIRMRELVVWTVAEMHWSSTVSKARTSRCFLASFE